MKASIFKRARQELPELDSYIKEEDIDHDLLSRKFLTEDELLLGVYFNSPEDFIAISTEQLHWFHGTVYTAIPYSEIVGVSKPDGREERLLELTVGMDNIVMLPIANETDGIPDIGRFYELMASVVHWPMLDDVSDQITKIQSREDAIQFLVNDGPGLTHYSAIAALRESFPDFWQLKKFEITPDLLNRPDTWRLLALFLSISKQSHPTDF